MRHIHTIQEEKFKKKNNFTSETDFLVNVANSDNQILVQSVVKEYTWQHDTWQHDTWQHS